MQACRGRISALAVAFGLVVLGGTGLSPAWPSPVWSATVWPAAEAAAQTTAPTATPTGTWSVAASPSPAGLMANQLNGVSCPASADCFAVGFSSTSSGTSALIETLGPTGWVLATTPQVPGSSVDELQGVSCASTTSCVAVGFYQQKGGSEQTLVETLANGTWSVITSPNSGAGNNVLTGVSCPEASACVAVGSYQSGATSRALAEELFGGSWVLTTVPTAGSGTNVLAGVSCAAVGACVTVGYYDNAGVDHALAENLSASVWSVMASQDQGAGLNELNAVSCTSTSSCVAVGTYRTAAGVNQDLIETLATATWSVHHPSPDANGANNVLSGVACTSTTSCMAVGHYNSKGVAQSLAIELAHGTWTVVPSPDKGTSTNQLAGVSCAPVSALECAAVGYFNDLISGYADVSAQALATAWSAGSWAMAAAADALAPNVAVNDVACPSKSYCVAVGSYVNSSGAHEVFIEDLDNGTWTMVPGPGPSATTNSLASVSCPSPTSCVAAGYYATRQDRPGPDREVRPGAVGPWPRLLTRARATTS